MSLDTSDVQSAIKKIESDMRRLQADVDRLRLAVDATEPARKTTAEIGLADVGLTLPAGVSVRDPDQIVSYLRTHSDLTAVAQDLAIALVDEFPAERSEITLAVYQDPEIDDRYLVFYVRVAEDGDTLLPRLRAIWDGVDRRFPPSADWVHVAPDYRPL